MPDMFGQRRVQVAMPSADLYRKTVSRDTLVNQFGESTVLRAEMATMMNVMIATGICTASEFVDIMIQQCQRIEQERRRDAGLEEDKG